VKNKYVILRHLGNMCLFTSALRASVNKSHIPSLPQNNLYKFTWLHAGEYSKTEIYKMTTSRFVEITNKEIREFKINSVPKNTKILKIINKNTKIIVGSVIIGEYSPRPRLGEYSR
jgi:hypothetical protein